MRFARTLACPMLSACLATASARAEDCALVESRSSLAALSGARIAAVDIVTEGAHLPGPAGRLDGLHATSRNATIRRQLLFAPGDTVDTLRVSETLRRLRRQRVFEDVVVAARRCGDAGGVTLLVRSRDAWTMRPTARLKTPSLLSFGIEDRNVFGSGRSVAVLQEMSLRGRGAALGIVDPWLFGTDLAGTLRLSSLGGAHAFRAGVRNHEYSVFDRWRAEANVARLSFGDTIVTERALHTVNAMVLVGRRIGGGTRSATTARRGRGVRQCRIDPIAGANAAARAAARSELHRRSTSVSPAGPRSSTPRAGSPRDAASSTFRLASRPTSWLPPATSAPRHVAALKLDAWLGRVWIPRRGSIFMADGWLSGYLGRGVDANHIARASFAWYADAPRGMWGCALTGEQMIEVDPDRRGAVAHVPRRLRDTGAPAQRRARRTLASRLRRSGTSICAGSAPHPSLDAGGFLAGSYRWRVEDVPGEQLRAGVVGLRARVLSANGTVNSIRFDVGYPVIRSEIMPNRAFALMTIGTLFDVSRQRDGRRVY